MAFVNREVIASAQIYCCDECGKEDVVGLRWVDRVFDPQSRSQGYPEICLWESHPLFRKTLCISCREAVRCAQDTPISRMPAGGLRARLYEAERCDVCTGTGCKDDIACQQGWRYGDKRRGLQLPTNPLTDSTWTKHDHIAMVIDERRERAIVLKSELGYYRPADMLGHDLSDLRYDLADDCLKKLVLCENTPRTPHPTVFEITLRDTIDEPVGITQYVEQAYGPEVAQRMRMGIGHTCHPFEINLRVPVEILQ